MLYSPTSNKLLVLCVQPLNLPVLAAAFELHAAQALPYWDATILAAARALGCTELYSEDLPHGRDIDGLSILDPFR